MSIESTKVILDKVQKDLSHLFDLTRKAINAKNGTPASMSLEYDARLTLDSMIESLIELRRL